LVAAFPQRPRQLSQVALGIGLETLNIHPVYARLSFLLVIREPPAASWWIVSPVILFLGAEERTARRGGFLRGATAISESGT
jgi:hypothetical protein